MVCLAEYVCLIYVMALHNAEVCVVFFISSMYMARFVCEVEYFRATRAASVHYYFDMCKFVIDHTEKLLSLNNPPIYAFIAFLCIFVIIEVYQTFREDAKQK